MAFSFSGSCSFVAFSASSRQFDWSWDTVTSYRRHQATLNLDLGLCNIEHPEIAVCVIVGLIAKLRFSNLLQEKALYSPAGALFYVKSSKAGTVQGLTLFWVLKV